MVLRGGETGNPDVEFTRIALLPGRIILETELGQEVNLMGSTQDRMLLSLAKRGQMEKAGPALVKGGSIGRIQRDGLYGGIAGGK